MTVIEFYVMFGFDTRVALDVGDGFYVHYDNIRAIPKRFWGYRVISGDVDWDCEFLRLVAAGPADENIDKSPRL